MARISSSENPLAIRSMMVPGRWPDLKSAIWLTISAAGRPASGGTGVPAFGLAAWQPEQDAAPGGASAAHAEPMMRRTTAEATKNRVAYMLLRPEVDGAAVDRRRPAILP